MTIMAITGFSIKAVAGKIRWLFHMNSLPTFLWKLPPKKPQFNDICVLFKHSNFCTRMLEKLCTLIRGPDFKFFPGGMSPDPL